MTLGALFLASWAFLQPPLAQTSPTGDTSVPSWWQNRKSEGQQRSSVVGGGTRTHADRRVAESDAKNAAVNELRASLYQGLDEATRWYADVCRDQGVTTAEIADFARQLSDRFAKSYRVVSTERFHRSDGQIQIYVHVELKDSALPVRVAKELEKRFAESNGLSCPPTHEIEAQVRSVFGFPDQPVSVPDDDQKKHSGDTQQRGWRGMYSLRGGRNTASMSSVENSSSIGAPILGLARSWAYRYDAFDLELGYVRRGYSSGGDITGSAGTLVADYLVFGPVYRFAIIKLLYGLAGFEFGVLLNAEFSFYNYFYPLPPFDGHSHETETIDVFDSLSRVDYGASCGLGVGHMRGSVFLELRQYFGLKDTPRDRQDIPDETKFRHRGLYLLVGLRFNAGGEK